MTSQERFERIEANLQAVTETLGVLASSQVSWREDMKRAMDRLIEAQVLNQQSSARLNESVSKYVDAAEARTKRLEENLDALIRAITAEHSNGKGKR
ncbi:MAG: hypothetical protein LAQ69_29020 [Acidobacteriia bacterium]|nr:hypothetical protein [Terriglobia bacterium]